MFNNIISLAYLFLVIVFINLYLKNYKNLIETQRVPTNTCGIYESCTLYGGELTVLENGVVCTVTE